MKRGPNWLDFEAACRYLFLCFHSREKRILLWHAVANPPCASSLPPLNGPSLSTGIAPPPSRRGWPSARKSSCCALRGWPSQRLPDAWLWGGGSSANGCSALLTSAFRGSPIKLAATASRSFPPAVAVHLVKL